MQPHLVPAARIIFIAVLVAGLSIVAPFGERTATADPVDDLLSEAAVKAALSLDPYLSSLPVTVRVVDGRTTVSGTLGHPAQKRFVMRKIGSVVDPSAILDEVSILSGKRTDGIEPTVPKDAEEDVQPGHRILKSIDKPADIAVPGRDIVDKLRKRAERRAEQPEVRTERGWKGRLHDALLAARVRRVLQRNILSSSIQVAASNGVVTLSGEVLAEDDVTLAEQLVEGLSGVASVKNELRVKQ